MGRKSKEMGTESNRGVGHKRRKGLEGGDGPCVAPIGAVGPDGGSV